jgi:hypothetical protein
MSQSVSVIIVEKTGLLKLLTIKDYKEEELFKKCGFKKADGFIRQTEWTIKYESKKYFVSVYGKIDGKANSENKYDFPPPIDNKLFFGNCLIIAKSKEDGTFVNLTLDMWEKMYEKLFGGFEDLALTNLEDEEEEDELANVPKEKKTKQGYLKDGFVIDSDEEDESVGSSMDEEDDDVKDLTEEEDELDEGLVLEDIGSELSEEEYDYSDDDK